MDAHFREYLGAVAGMQELYGEPALEHTDFHPQPEAVDCPLTGVEPVVVAEVRDSVASADAATFAKAV